MNKITTIIFISLLAGACSPQPYVRNKTPAINGTLRINDIAALGTPIFLSLDASDTECSHFVQKTLTDEQGRFTVLAEKEHMDYTPLMTHYLDEWIICTEIQGLRRVLYSNNRYGMGSAPRTITLTCHIDSRSKNESPCQPDIHD